MKEITDAELATLRKHRHLYSVVVRQLLDRLDRVEGERDQYKERLTFQDRWLQGGIYYTNEEATQLFEKHASQLTTLRERMKRMEEALQNIANPIGYLQKEAGKEGNVLSGMAHTIARDSEFLKGIAQAALKEVK